MDRFEKLSTITTEKKYISHIAIIYRLFLIFFMDL